jgi:Fuc2NAc and GlcNAc transferase
MIGLLLVVAAFAAGYLGTGAARRLALRHALLDIPNARSSHAVPTPRGGGISVAATGIAAAGALGLAGVLEPGVALARAGGGAAVAVIGLLDDVRGVPAALRAAVHLLAAVWAVGWIGGMPSLRLGEATLALGPAGAVIAVVGIVWMTNLYNFMDGIDGIAGVEALTAGGIGGALLLGAGQPGLGALALALGAAAAGFLPWNWSPARIFMGDVGSGFLGFAFAVVALASERTGAVPLLAWLVLLGVFAVDATLTLLRRVLGGERWHQAHRSHAYQRAVLAGLSHARVSGCVLIVNLVLGALALSLVHLPGTAAVAVLVGGSLLGALYAGVERLHPMRPAVPATRSSE